MTVIHVSVVHVSFAEANVYRNSSAYLLRKTLYEVGSRRTAMFIKMNSGNTQYIYYFRLIFPLAFIYLFTCFRLCFFLPRVCLFHLPYLLLWASLTFSFNSYFLSCFSFLFISHVLVCSFFLARSSFSFIIMSS